MLGTVFFFPMFWISSLKFCTDPLSAFLMQKTCLTAFGKKMAALVMETNIGTQISEFYIENPGKDS
jgi:hypothetical protein